MKTNLTRKFSLLFLLLVGVVSYSYSQVFFEVTAPASIAGTYDYSHPTDWSGAFPTCSDNFTISGDLMIIDDGDDEGGTGTTTDGCQAAVNDLTGMIALVDRGVCEFGLKALNAQNAGAIAVIICNNVPGDPPPGLGAGADGAMVTVPVWSITYDDCQTIRAEIPTVSVEINYVNPPTGDDVVLWDGGQFDGGLGDWTVSGISSDTSLWEWHATGSATGPLTGGLAIVSPSICNGAVIFDSDLDNTGVGGSPPYPMHSGELISPVIDCSTCPPVSLKFYQHQIMLNSNNAAGSASFAYSIDGGDSWSPNIPVSTENVLTGAEQNLIGSEIRRFFLPDLAGQSNVRIKFLWDGDFYFWALDDIQLIQPENNNLVVMDNFYAIATNAMWPEDQLEGEVFSFLADIANVGAVAQPNTVLNINIEGPTGSVYSEDLSYGLVEADSLYENEPFAGAYSPSGSAGDLFTGTYSISSDSVDFDPSDNTATFQYMITDSIFAKEFAPTFGVRPGAASWMENEPHSWGYGNMYHVVAGSDAANVEDRWYAGSVSFGISGVPSGTPVSIYLYEWPEDLPPPDMPGTPGNGNAETEERNRVAFAFYEADGEENGNELITLPLNPLGSDNGETGNVKLQSNMNYILMVEYFTENVGEDLNISAGDDWEYSAQAFRTNQSQFGDVPYRPSGMIAIGNPEDVTFDAGSFTNLIPAVRLHLASEFPTVSTDELDPANIVNVTPNPADNFFNLNLSLVNTQPQVKVNVVDVTGKIVISTTYRFDTGNLAAGTYFINVITEDGVRTQRLMVQR